MSDEMIFRNTDLEEVTQCVHCENDAAEGSNICEDCAQFGWDDYDPDYNLPSYL